MIDQVGQYLDEGPVVQQQFMVVRAEVSGHEAGVIQLVVGGVADGKADGKRLDLRGVHGAHQPGNDAGIDAPAEEHAQGDVGNETALDGLAEQAPDSFEVILFPFVFSALRRRRRPVPRYRHF